MRFEVDACRVFYCTLSERRLVADSCVLGREFFFSLKKNGYVYYTTRLLRNAFFSLLLLLLSVLRERKS